MGLLYGLGRFHKPQSKQAPTPQLLSLHSRAHEPQQLSAYAATSEVCASRACAPQQEKLLR